MERGRHRYQTIETRKLDTRFKMRWPAIIFAAKRIDRVRGRIISLIVSTIAKKRARPYEMPLGVRVANVSPM